MDPIAFFCDLKTMSFAWSKTKKTEWRKKWKTTWRLEVPKHVHAKKHSYEVLYQCMPSCISRKCLLDGQTYIKMLCWRPRSPSVDLKIPLITRRLLQYFPQFFRGKENPLCWQAERVKTGLMDFSLNTWKKIRRLLKGGLLEYLIFKPI